MRICIHYAAAVAALVLASATADAQSRDTTSQARRPDSITVVVSTIDHDGRALLSDADVHFGTRAPVRTDWTGEVNARWRRGDSPTIRVLRAGYAAFDTTFIAPNADFVQLSVAMTKQAQALAATEVRAAASTPAALSPVLAEIAQRQQKYKGYFVGPEELDRARDRAILDVMRTQMPSVRLDWGGPGYVARSNRGPTSIQGHRNQKSAEILVYIDGVYQPAPELSNMRGAEFVAIEYYPETTVPPQFRRAGVQNGVILLWTK